MWPTAETYAEAIVARLKKDSTKRVAAVSTLHENTVDLIDLLQEKVEQEAEIEILLDERVAPDSADLRASFLKIEKSKPDAIFLNLFEGQIGLAAQQAREAGLSAPFFGNAVMSETELELAPKALEGLWFPRFDGVRKEKLALFGKEELAAPDSAAAAHDALLAILNALDGEDCQRRELAEALGSESNFDGISGSFGFRDQNATVELSLYVVRDGEISSLSFEN